MSIRWKLFLPIIGVIIIFLVSLVLIISSQVSSDIIAQNEGFSKTFVDAVYSQVEQLHYSVEREKGELIHETRRRLQELVDVAVDAIANLHQLSMDGALSEAEAKNLAVEQVRAMEFGVDGYFWIDDTDYINLLLTPNPSVEGTSRFELQDHTGQFLVQQFVDNSVRDGESWLQYFFPRPGETEPAEKLGYTKLFEPWGWVIGTGEYVDVIDDRSAEFEEAIIRGMNQSLYVDRSRSDYPFIFGSDGEFIAYINQDLVGTRPDIRDTETGEDLVERFFEVGEGKIRYNFTKPGVEGSFPKEGYVRVFEERGWVIAYTFYPDDALAVVTRFSRFLILVAVGGVILLSALILLSVNGIVQALRKTTASMATIAQGSGDLTFRLPVTTKDELGKLALNFNEMMEKLQNLVRTLKHSSNEGELIGEQLSSNTEEISTALEEMSATGLSINESSKRLVSEIDKSATSLKTIVQTMEVLDGNAENESEAVAMSSSAVEQMVASIGNITRISHERAEEIRGLSNKAHQGKEEMDMTRGDVDNIAESAGAIQDVLKVIQDISGQINLLAMNAAIEAAHAGDAGRGFAVVADEIRKLAESTAQNSNQIAESIQDIVQNIEHATERSKQTASSIDAIAQETANSALAMEEIFAALEEVNQGTTQINEALSNLVHSSAEVRDASQKARGQSESSNQALEQIRQLSQQSEQAMAEISSALVETSHAIQDIRDLGVKNSHIQSKLLSEFDRFVVEEENEAPED